MSVSSSFRLKNAVVAALSVTTLSIAAVATPALAQQGAPARTAPDLVVKLCDVDALSQPAFRNVDGARPVFVTADQVFSARASGERWTTARCMTPVQHQRLTQRMSPRHNTAMASTPRSDARF